jgi:hypothetical protein
MQKEISQIIQLARLRVELNKQFPTVKQSFLLDTIQNNQTELLTEYLQRPLTLIEQQMVLDYKIHWQIVESVLKERKEIIEQRNQIDIAIEKELQEQRELVPDDLKEVVERLSNKLSSTKKEIKPVLVPDASKENFDNILPIEIIEKISSLNLNIPVTALVEHIKEKEHNLIEERINRKMEVDELIAIRSIEKMLLKI